MKATRVQVEFTLNDASSLIAYLDVLRQAMAEKLDLPFELSAANWQGAARCLEPLKQAVKGAKKK